MRWKELGGAEKSAGLVTGFWVWEESTGDKIAGATGLRWVGVFEKTNSSTDEHR
jgi:hypothetical protein